MSKNDGSDFISRRADDKKSDQPNTGELRVNEGSDARLYITPEQDHVRVDTTARLSLHGDPVERFNWAVDKAIIAAKNEAQIGSIKVGGVPTMAEIEEMMTANPHVWTTLNADEITTETINANELAASTNPFNFQHIRHSGYKSDKKCVIFDIDHTLAKMPDHREEMLEGDVDWIEFNKRSIYDTPIRQTVELVRMYDQNGYAVVMITGRDYSSAAETQIWLMKHKIPCHMLLMRPIGNAVPNHKLKWNYLTMLQEVFQIEAAYEDNPEVVSMYEEEGIQTFQVGGRK